MESSHSVGGANAFIALFQQIYTIVIESILSQSCTKSVTVYLSKNKQPRNNRQHMKTICKLHVGKHVQETITQCVRATKHTKAL